MHLALLGEVDEMINRQDPFVYDLHVVEGEQLVDDALGRIRQASGKYRLKPNVVQTLISQFLAGTTWR